MRTGVLYRADDPVRMTSAGRGAIEALDLEAVVDLRQRSQVERSAGFADPAITYHVPVVDYVIDTETHPVSRTRATSRGFTATWSTGEVRSSSGR
jgi:hypothetical protein